MNKPMHILAMRFSSMGDVAMTVPVIKEMLQQNPHVTITFVSRPLFAPFFSNIERLTFLAADVDKSFKGPLGFIKLFKFIHQNQKFNAVADLHNHIRTNALVKLFQLKGIKTAVLDKGRKEKKELTRRDNKVLKPLRSTHERYADVFRKLNIDIHLSHVLTPSFSASAQKKVGIFPFARYGEKTYPHELMEKIIAELSSRNITIYIFGAGADEEKQGLRWQLQFPNVKSVINQMKLADEMELVKTLEVLLVMDSAGMHIASLLNKPAVSVWGATHPFAGFAGYGQNAANFIQYDLYCRPCSVYGNKPCYRGDHACMHNIMPAQIIQKINRYL